MFEGLTNFPREREELKNHLGRINHTLQHKYHAKVPEFVLRADRTAEFYQYYQEEVTRVIAHLSRITNKDYRVRVDPRRLARGFELRKGHAVSPSKPPSPPPADASWTQQLEEQGKRLRQEKVIADQRSRIVSSLPGHGYPENSPNTKYQGYTVGKTPNNKINIDDDAYISTDAAELRRRNEKNKLCLQYPPAFNGFQNVSPQ